MYVCIYCGGRSKQQTQWAWRQASERLLFNRNNKIVSKGDEVSKINRGSGVLVMLRGSWRKGPGKGRSPVAARAPLWRLPLAASSSFWPAALPGVYGPSSWPVSRLAGAVLDAQRSLPGPTRTPACMHGEETGLPRRGALGIYQRRWWGSIHFRCASSHAARPGCFQRPSSLTHPLPSGAWWRAAIKGRGDADN